MKVRHRKQQTERDDGTRFMERLKCNIYLNTLPTRLTKCAALFAWLRTRYRAFTPQVLTLREYLKAKSPARAVATGECVSC